MTNSPCCPNKISLINVKIANQKTGVMSTPKAGGILPFASLNKGSDGHATIAHGNSLRFVSGYQEETTRQSIAKDMKFKKGPKNVAVGLTQASVSASNNPLPEVTAALTVSETEEAIVGSIIDKDDDPLASIVEAIGDVGATKADALLIIVATTQQRIAVNRYILICLCFQKFNRKRCYKARNIDSEAEATGIESKS
jgi:hypothetical protein